MVLALAGTSCRPEVADRPLQETTASVGSPSLVRVSAPGPVAELADAISNIAVSAFGTMFVTLDVGEEPLLALFDSTGAVVRRFGRLGEGPGELRRAGFLAAVGDSFAIVSPNRPVVIFFSPTGDFLSERGLHTVNAMGLAADQGSVDLGVFAGPGGGMSAVITESLRDGSSSEVMTVAEPFVREAADAAGPGFTPWPPPYARTGASLFVGNGRTYRIRWSSAPERRDTVFGRDLPPRLRGPAELAERRAELEVPASVASPARAGFQAMLDTVELEVIPHFGRNALHLDGKGRLWVIGGTNDSTFADIFVGPTFLTRIMVPCLLPNRGIALTGAWLALRCQSYTVEGGLELQLYRITESGPPPN